MATSATPFGNGDTIGNILLEAMRGLVSHVARHAMGVALLLPGCDFGDDGVFVVDTTVEALAPQDADLDLDHVEPTGVLGRVVELQSLQHPSSLRGGEMRRKARRRNGWSGCPSPRG